MRILRLLVVLALVLVLVPVTPLIAAEERFINVENIQIASPGEDVPKETAAFSGAWEGEIADQYGSQPHRLYVQGITKKEAKITCAFGTSQGWREVQRPETWSKTARVKKRKLVVTTPHGNEIEYKINKKGTEIDVTVTIYHPQFGPIYVTGKMKRI
jgi:hypothetical protein